MVEEEPETPPGVRLVVDANLVFSCILRSDGAIGELLLRSSHLFDLYAPEFLELELTKHRERLLMISKLDEEALDVALSLVLERLTFVNESLISKASWQDAEKLLAAVDQFDIPYLALSLEFDCMLWTGDRRVFKGLRKRGFMNVVDTHELLRLRDGL